MKRQKQLRISQRLQGNNTTYMGMVSSKVTPAENDYDEHELTLTPDSIRAIATLKDAVDMSEEAIPTNMLSIVITTLHSNEMTPAEAAMGHFTRRKLQKLENWGEWLQGEKEQLDGFYQQGMFGHPTDPLGIPKNAVILRPHWNYMVKQDGTQ